MKVEYNNHTGKFEIIVDYGFGLAKSVARDELWNPLDYFTTKEEAETFLKNNTVI